MNQLTRTNRTYTNVETGYNCRLYTSHDASKYHLIYEDNPPEAPAEGSEVNGYYIASHTGATIRLNNKREIFVDRGEFYNYKEGEMATHRKFVGFKKFTRL